LPSDAKWNVLMEAVGGSSTAGSKLKAASGWSNRNDGTSGNGTDDYGFSALPGGDGNSDGSFGNVGLLGYWWSANEYDGNYAHSRNMNYGNDYVLWGSNNKSNLRSVRYLQD
jgi:uncharacterized protein (TIGR02145 family)